MTWTTGQGPDDDERVRGDEQPEPEEVQSEPADRKATGDSRVAAALDRLDSLADRPPPEHVEVYEDVHSTLQDVLAEATGRADEHPA